MDLIQRATLKAKAADDPKAQAAHLYLSAQDPVYWFNTFCWTYDPRLLEIGKDPNQPFNLYPFQEWCVREWVGAIDRGEDFGIEKCRDMGISWIILLIFQWGWLFHRWDTHVGSKKTDDVDQRGNLKTLFPKMRYNLGMLPEWMLPEGFNWQKHDCFLRLINPATGASITGESANPFFARSGRAKAVLFDEFAFWDYGEAAWTSASQSTNCRIALSTPYGKANKFADLMLDPEDRYNNYRLEAPRAA